MDLVASKIVEYNELIGDNKIPELKQDLWPFLWVTKPIPCVLATMPYREVKFIFICSVPCYLRFQTSFHFSGFRPIDPKRQRKD